MVDAGNSKLGVISALKACREAITVGCDKCFKRDENVVPWKQRWQCKGDGLSKAGK